MACVGPLEAFLNASAPFHWKRTYTIASGLISLGSIVSTSLVLQNRGTNNDTGELMWVNIQTAAFVARLIVPLLYCISRLDGRARVGEFCAHTEQNKLCNGDEVCAAAPSHSNILTGELKKRGKRDQHVIRGTLKPHSYSSILRLLAREIVSTPLLILACVIVGLRVVFSMSRQEWAWLEAVGSHIIPRIFHSRLLPLTEFVQGGISAVILILCVVYVRQRKIH